uniref:Uncharacterized protein n=1 Tax=Glossina austeni TaxID=7395 RepID=A0A1A9V3M7_GLOAU
MNLPRKQLSSKRRNKNELFPAESVQVIRLSVYCVDDGQSVSLTTFVIISKASARLVLHSFQPTIRRHLSLNLTKTLKILLIYSFTPTTTITTTTLTTYIHSQEYEARLVSSLIANSISTNDCLAGPTIDLMFPMLLNLHIDAVFNIVADADADAAAAAAAAAADADAVTFIVIDESMLAGLTFNDVLAS